MKISTACLSAAGGRPSNQDAVIEDWMPTRDRGVLAVADGLGGHRGGEVASALAGEALVAAFHAAPGQALEQLGDLIAAANARIVQGQEMAPELVEMRTTLVLLVIDGGHARWGHCGDSRLYGFRGARLVWQTLDDSVPRALVNLGEIPPEAIRQHADRNRLTRCLGSPGVLRHTVAEPVDLAVGDAFLLCSDGFWEYVYETEMAVDLAKAVDVRDWLDRMAARLPGRVPAGHGNHSALAVWVESD